ncbi:MOB kinase activator 2-like isoform X1 [Brachionus plicatilis]|uniref:MOB kinase activator 2-like isoform X1 n=1 Tax=Brachionus plicatilis TaxID=10195 RepID=A0A3M7PME2_BRAPC|nr:MOB kinase activator 2-like isoform X1 [Brachionus plicatilis]
MDTFKRLGIYFNCPKHSKFKNRKSRKRDKSDEDIETNYDQESPNFSNPLNAYYTKHIEKHLRKEQSQSEDPTDEEISPKSIRNKLKSQISLPFINKETKNSNNIPGILKPKRSFKESKIANDLNDNFKSLDLNQSPPKSNPKLATLPFDKKSRLNLESSVLSTNSSLNTSNNSSIRTISNSSSTSTDTDSGANQIDILSKTCLNAQNSPHWDQEDMLMTNNNKALNYTSSSNNYQSTTPIVQQPQFVSHTMSTSVFLSPNMNTPVQNGTSSATTLTPISSAKSNNGDRITSLSYLDDSNLKLACVDPNDLTKLTKLQQSIDHNEWLAYNTKMFFDQINVLFGAIAEQCTLRSCSNMSGPNNSQFFWLDEKGKKLKYSASQYIDTSLTHISKITSDESLFPIQHGHQFPSNFESLVKRIHKYLFHILAHMYHSHYKELVHLKLNSFINNDKDLDVMDALNKSMVNKFIDCSIQQQQLLLNQPTPNIHNATQSSSSSGFSFFKKKLNFNLMA